MIEISPPPPLPSALMDIILPQKLDVRNIGGCSLEWCGFLHVVLCAYCLQVLPSTEIVGFLAFCARFPGHAASPSLQEVPSRTAWNVCVFFPPWRICTENEINPGKRLNRLLFYLEDNSTRNTIDHPVLSRPCLAALAIQSAICICNKDSN